MLKFIFLYFCWVCKVTWWLFSSSSPITQNVLPLFPLPPIPTRPAALEHSTLPPHDFQNSALPYYAACFLAHLFGVSPPPPDCQYLMLFVYFLRSAFPLITKRHTLHKTKINQKVIMPYSVAHINGLYSVSIKSMYFLL